MIQWVGIFLNSISGILLGTLAFIFALTGLASLTFELASGPEALKMIIIRFMVFMVPVAGEVMAMGIIVANDSLREFINS